MSMNLRYPIHPRNLLQECCEKVDVDIPVKVNVDQEWLAGGVGSVKTSLVVWQRQRGEVAVRA